MAGTGGRHVIHGVIPSPSARHKIKIHDVGHVGALTLPSPYKYTTSNYCIAARHFNLDTDSLRTRTNAKKNKSMRKKFPIGQSLTLRMNRSCNNHR